MVVYDTTDQTTFNNTKSWLQEIDRYACESVQKLMVGTKIDLSRQRVVDKNHAEEFCEQLGIGYAETSAKTGQGVFEAFAAVTSQIAAAIGGISGEVSAASEAARAPPPPRVQQGSDSEDESFSEEELKANIKDAAKMSKEKSKAKPSGSKNKAPNARRLKAEKADVNVFRLDLSSLAFAAELTTGDPVRCRGCGVFLNLFSKVHTAAESANNAAPALELAPPIHEKFENCMAELVKVGKSQWDCEFCGHANGVDFAEEELKQITASASVDYLVLQPEAGMSEKENAPISVFCIDVSGSMCVTSEVPGNVTYKGSESRDKFNRQLQKTEGEGGHQFFHGQKKNVTHVSRLQCVQAAVAAQIEKLAVEAPTTRVALVTFSDEVKMLGDGAQPEVTVSGDRLSDFAQLKEIASAFAVKTAVRESKEGLLQRLWALEEGGQTALGPALACSIFLAAQSSGSSVLLATDGLANKGIGSLEDLVDDTTAGMFYQEMGEQGRLNGVTVSIVSLIGTEARLDTLSIVCEATRGMVDRVEATKMSKELTVSKPVVATSCMALLCLHKGLHFKGEFDDELERRNWLVRDLGTVHSQDEVTCSYGFRPKEQSDMTGITHVPFQVQILHRRADGTMILRVATAQIELTVDRLEAEKGADVKVVATHAVQKAAQKAKNGDFQEAQLQMRSAQRFLARAGDEEVLNKWSHNMEAMDNVLNTDDAAGEEAARPNDNNAPPPPPPQSSSASGKRGKKKSDKAATKISQMANVDQSSLF